MSDYEECDYFEDQTGAMTEVTATTELTCAEAFEKRIPYGFTRSYGSTTLKVINRLLNERGLEIASLNNDFGREMAFIIQEKE